MQIQCSNLNLPPIGFAECDGVSTVYVPDWSYVGTPELHCVPLVTLVPRSLSYFRFLYFSFRNIPPRPAGDRFMTRQDQSVKWLTMRAPPELVIEFPLVMDIPRMHINSFNMRDQSVKLYPTFALVGFMPSYDSDT